MATVSGYSSSIHYVTLLPTAPPVIAKWFGHIGILEKQETEIPYGLPGGQITWYIVRFIVNGQLARIHGEKSAFADVPAANVPPEVLAAFENDAKQTPAQALAIADKAETAAFKTRRKYATEVQARLDALFEKSTTFWRNWKGHGPPPRSDKDPPGTDATNRKAPKII